MADLNKIIEKIENFAPLELASVWDNSGWQVKLGNNSVNKALLALTITEDIVNQAINNNCDLIISHHPMLFEKFNKISAENKALLPVIKAVQNNIQVYSAHTNLDFARGGIADKLAELFGLQNIFVPEYLEDNKFVRIGELHEYKDLRLFIEEIKNKLKAPNVKLINNSNVLKVKTIAIVPGGGASFTPNLKDIDLLLTGDVKYHNALEAENFAVIDAGHFETERIILPVLKDLLAELDIEIIIAGEQPVWEII